MEVFRLNRQDLQTYSTACLEWLQSPPFADVFRQVRFDKNMHGIFKLLDDSERWAL